MIEPYAPDPHLVYRYLGPADAPPQGCGPIIVVGTDGVYVLPVANDSRSGRSGVPDASRFCFPRYGEAGTPRFGDPDAPGGPGEPRDPAEPPGLHQIAVWRGEPVLAVAVGAVRPRLEQVGYRELYGAIGEDELALVARAMQIVDWDVTTRYCSRCGSPVTPAPAECVKRCARCEHSQYPRIAPAMIVGIVRDGTLLLAQSPRFRGRFHSILAGFLEPGETAEACVRREVYEEVGIAVRNIRFFGSQPWPFPHSLMLGFVAEYESGELKPQPDEIVDAGWFGPQEMPDVPGEVSISGRIINWFRTAYG